MQPPVIERRAQPDAQFHGESPKSFSSSQVRVLVYFIQFYFAGVMLTKPRAFTILSPISESLRL